MDQLVTLRVQSSMFISWFLGPHHCVSASELPRLVGFGGIANSLEPSARLSLLPTNALQKNGCFSNSMFVPRPVADAVHAVKGANLCLS